MRNCLKVLMSVVGVLAVLSIGVVAQAKPKVKEWTFLTFINGNNNLDSFGAFNINEMEEVGSTDDINVVVQWASYGAGTTKRLLVQKDNSPYEVTSPVIESMGIVDMGDYKTLVEFIKWGVTNYPAHHYFVNIWDHGGGWHVPVTPSTLEKMTLMGSFSEAVAMDPRIAIAPSDISWDDYSKHFMTTAELGLAMNEAATFIGHKVDIYGSDACLMAMPEVSTEMAKSVSVFVGSQEVEPGKGWPYQDFLRAWAAESKGRKNASPKEVATILTNTYVDSYSGGSHGDQEVTFSAFDLSKTGTLISGVKVVSMVLKALPVPAKKVVLNLMGTTQNFYPGIQDYGDMMDFSGILQTANIEGVQPKVLEKINKAMGGFVIANRVTPAYSRAHGISVWMPTTLSTLNWYMPKYKDLQFNKQTGWGDALQSILSANQ